MRPNELLHVHHVGEGRGARESATYGAKWVNLHSKICLYTSVCGSPFEISKKQIGTEGVYGNYAMPSSLARHHIRESCNAILFSQSSYMWIVSCHIFFHNLFHLSTMFIHSSTLPVHQPFESVMGKSGVKTRSSEQSVLPVDADFLLVTDSSSEEDSERDE